jgi:mono/diheme cytochrome c family protein
MSFTENLPKYLVIAVFVGGLGAFAYQNLAPSQRAKKIVRVDVRVPELSAVSLKGKQAFDANCAQCHGQNASGTDKGPPLIHDIYNPGHHGDQAFLLAAKRGVRQHHWPYGDMPKQPQVTNAEIAAIVKYVRELQVANGITYKPHRM